MGVEDRAPTLVAQRCGPGGGADDVGEEHRREDAVRVAAAELTREELLDFVKDSIRIPGPQKMIGAIELYVAGARDVRRQITPERYGVITRFLTVQDEGGNGNSRENGAQIRLHGDVILGPCHCGACPSTARSLPPLPKNGVVVETRQEKTNVVNGLAATLDPQYPTGKIAEHGGRHSLRVVGCLREPGEGMGQYLRSDPLRAGCTQEYRDHPATAMPEDGGSVGTCRVEHRLRVADRVLDARWRGQRYWVREPDAAWIEADQPAEGGEAALKLVPQRLLVPYLDRDVGPTGGLEQIDRPVPDHLVGDMRAV